MNSYFVAPKCQVVSFVDSFRLTSLLSSVTINVLRFFSNLDYIASKERVMGE